MSVDILTFGCRLNAFESEVIRGHTAHLDDVVVINSCAVTAEAEKQARRAVARAHAARPGARIMVTGCAAQINPRFWAALPGVSRVLGNMEKLQPAHWAQDASAAVGDIMGARHAEAPPVTDFAGKARAFLAVQQGCDHRCSFCVIPFGRGPSRSVPVGVLVDQARALVAAGYREIVLTGVDIASYGGDLPGRPRLGEMARRLLALVPELPRLRLSSIDPAGFDAALWTLLAEEARLMPHLHLSLQAGSDMILKRMKRRHSVAQAGAVIARARLLRPGLAIGADLIAGFPTETDAHFAETLHFLRDHALPYLHVFPYSERAGTPAARMPPVPPAVRRARAAVLRAEGDAARAAFLGGMIGRSVQVLSEAGGGHTEHFAPVAMDVAPGRLIRGVVLGVAAGRLEVESAAMCRG